jgi:hypothetical protein
MLSLRMLRRCVGDSSAQKPHSLPRVGLRGLAFAVAILFLQVQAVGVAQITASQGEDPNRLKSFHSPMVLEFAAPGLMQATSPAGWSIQGVQGFNCDGAYFSSLILKVSGKAKSGVKVQVEGALAVGPSSDREAKVIVELLVEGQSIGRGWKEKIDAEERKVKPFRFSFRLSPEASMRLEQSKNAVVRVTLFVWEL